MVFEFECWEDGRWFVVLPEWDGDQGDHPDKLYCRVVE